MKKIVTLIICLFLVGFTFVNLDFFVETFSSLVNNKDAVVPDEISEYMKDYSLSFVNYTDDFTPYSYQDILNILYSAINNGYDSFTFYCPDEYTDCKSDVENISYDVNTLTHINNFVHPYNSFTNFTITITDLGEINVVVEYLYSDDVIAEIEKEVDGLIAEFITDNMNDEDKILVFHDYIINNATYDTAFNKNEESDYSSSTAYGPLFEGFAICNGYTDLMAIILNKLDIINIKIATTPDEISYSNTGHIWNAVYLDGEWLHLDLTWDDPLSEYGENYLYYTYFLITTDELHEIDYSYDVAYEEHNFSSVIYYEIR